MSNIYEFIFYFLGGAVTGLCWFALKTYRSHPREIMLHTRFFFYHILKKKKTGLLIVNHCSLQQMKKIL